MLDVLPTVTRAEIPSQLYNGRRHTCSTTIYSMLVKCPEWDVPAEAPRRMCTASVAKQSEEAEMGRRCVVVVGLPFPNPADPELRERMAYLDRTAAGTQGPGDPSPGRQYYEDLCMKAVNQCVGRVIRHRNDWAAILLADTRYVSKCASSYPSVALI